jgi:BMFP domain-containing protein YqiC
MTNIHFGFQKHMSRRAMLRGAGVALALPMLEAMTPAFARADAAPTPRRFVSVSNALGFHGPYLFPAQAGRTYTPSRYLTSIADLRNQFTIFSGVSHPNVGGGHKAEACILSAAPYAGGNFRNTISLDQYMAKHLGGRTRFPSLVLNTKSESSPSYTENGSMIAAENLPLRLFNRLFVPDTREAQAQQQRRLRQGRSVMDIVGAEARAMQQRVSAGDREKLDAYFSSVRELEQRLAANESWAQRPKHTVTAQPPQAVLDGDDLLARQRVMLDVMFLAIQTDSTRFITLHTNGSGEVIPIPGVEEGYHSLSHHGQDAGKIEQLARIEAAQVSVWGDFVRKLKDTRENGGTLLDHTMVLLTSNLGNASAHDNKNMPVIFAGGRFRHGQHLAFDRRSNYPLPNLYVSALQELGLETDRFASSTGTMRGLDRA